MTEEDITEFEVTYALSKQLNDDYAPMEISTNYGNVPLTDGDRAAVRELLREIFNARLEWKRIQKTPATKRDFT